MQQAVTRDKNGKSDYAMVSINPSRINKTYQDLKKQVDSLGEDRFVQIVNYNIEGQQYILAGKINDLKYLISKFEGVEIPEFLSRTSCSIPLRGIDVPFHSKLLKPHVNKFRNLLIETTTNVKSKTLVNKYIPNLVGQYFKLEKSFVKECLNYCDSEILNNLLINWDQINDEDKTKKIVVELLAYQFASPVQWINTLKNMLKTQIKSAIEIGPSPVLIKMIKKSSDGKYQQFLIKILLCY